MAAQARAFEPLFDALLARVEDVETSTATERLLQEVRPRSPAPFLKVLNGKRPRASAPPTPRQDLALRVLRRSFPDALRALAETRPGRIPAEARGDARPRASSLALPVREIRDGFEAVLIPAGVFTMGSPGGEPGRLDNEFQHEVELSAFAISRTCVTNRIYDAFRLARPDIPEPPSRHQRGFDDPECPVTSITWDEARKCAQWLGGDLPTEAQWEYACRSGKTTAFSTGASPDANFEAAAWFSKNSGGTPHPVAQKAPNAWGLFDVHGNVWEWCRDWCGEYPLKRTKDPEGPPTGAHRVLRGGSYWNDADWCRSAFRWGWGPGDRNVSHGFRVAFPAFPPSLGEPRSSNLGH